MRVLRNGGDLATIGNNRKEDIDQYRRLLQALRLALNNNAKSAYSIAQQINDLHIHDMDGEIKSAVEGLLARSPEAEQQARRTLDAMYKPAAQPVEGEAAPGSEAWRAQREIDASQQGADNASRGMGKAFGAAEEEGKQGRVEKWLSKQRDNFVKKIAKEAIKKAIMSALSAIATYVGGLSMPVIVGVLCVLLFVVFASNAWSNINKTPNERGGVPLGAHAANPVADKDFIEKLMIGAGDTTVSQDKISAYVAEISPKLAELKTLLQKPENAAFPNLQQIIADIDTIDAKLQTAQTNAGNATGLKAANEARTMIRNFLNYISGSIEPFVGSKSLPFPAGTDPDLTRGIGLHFNTLWLKENANGHRTYQFFGPTYNSGDAADLYVSPTTPVLAVMDGKLVKIADGVYYLYGKDTNNHEYTVTYAHIQLELENGLTMDTIKAGKKIGHVLNSHLHFEITKDGKPINFQSSDINGTTCGGLKYYDIGDDSGNYGSAHGSKRCANYHEGSTTTMASFFWQYTKTIFGS